MNIRKALLLLLLFSYPVFSEIDSTGVISPGGHSPSNAAGSFSGTTLNVGEIQLLKSDGTQVLYVSSSADAGGRGALLYSVSLIAPSSSVVHVGPGIYNMAGNKLTFSTGVYLSGSGIDNTVIQSTIAQNNGVAIVPWENGHISDLTHTVIDNTYTQSNIGGLSTDFPVARFVHNFLGERCKFVGSNDVLHINVANKIGFTWKFRDCIFEGHGSDAIAVLNSTLAGSQIDFYDCYAVSSKPPSFGGSFGVNCRALSNVSSTTVVNVWGGTYLVTGNCTTVNSAIRTNVASASTTVSGPAYLYATGTNAFDMDGTLGPVNYGPGVVFNPGKVNGTIRAIGPNLMFDSAPRTNVTPNTTGQFILNTTNFEVCVASCVTAANCWVKISTPSQACAN